MSSEIKQYETLHALFNAVERAPRDDRAEILKANNSIGVRDVLKINFDKNVDLGLPEGPPPYTPFEGSGAKNTPPKRLANETPRLRSLLPGSGVIRAKAEAEFISILENIDPLDAKVLILAKDRTLAKRFKVLSLKLIEEAFPGLL